MRTTQDPTDGARSISADPARDAHDLLRAEWTYGADVTPRDLPVDPFFIAKSLGIIVFLADMPDDVSGALRRDAWGEPQILVNQNDHRNRQRFTCAHEVGHYVRRSALRDTDYEFIDFRSTLASAGVDAEEIYANQFAAELLMPRSLMEHFQHSEVVDLARRFGVSKSAVGFRLSNLRLG